MAAAAFRDAGVRWVCAGWTVFTVENLVMPFGAVHSALYISVLLLCRKFSIAIVIEYRYHAILWRCLPFVAVIVCLIRVSVTMQSTITYQYHCYE